MLIITKTAKDHCLRKWNRNYKRLPRFLQGNDFRCPLSNPFSPHHASCKNVNSVTCIFWLLMCFIWKSTPKHRKQADIMKTLWQTKHIEYLPSKTFFTLWKFIMTPHVTSSSVVNDGISSSLLVHSIHTSLPGCKKGKQYFGQKTMSRTSFFKPLYCSIRE